MLEFKNMKEDKNMVKYLKGLYVNAFPRAERVPFFMLRRRALRENADFYGIYNDEEFVGLTYTVKYMDIIYVFYLAFEPESRGKGFGSAALEEIKSRFDGYRIILNIEKPDANSSNNEERIRRRSFYEKNGFKRAGFTTIEKGVEFEMLRFGDKVARCEFDALLRDFLGRIYTGAYIKPDKN